MQATTFLRMKCASRAPVTAMAMHRAFMRLGACLPPAMAVIKLLLRARVLRLAECVHRVTSDASMDVSEIKRKALDMLVIIENT